MKTILRIMLPLCLLAPAVALAQTGPKIGQLVDYSGPTSDVGIPYGQGVADALAHINATSGIGGKPFTIETSDYSYQAPRAISQYKKWSAGNGKVAAIQGWGTADTEALSGFVGKDEILFYSASYSGHLTDPTGASGRSKGTPYNFFYGASYSDALRAMLMWAAEDWKAKGASGKPKYVHMGANHPYPNAPKEAGEAMAKELGFDVLPAVQFSLTPGDYTAQCLTLKQAGVNYAFLGNTSGSNIAVMRSCETVGAKVQFLGNVFGMDETAIKAAGSAADGVVFPLRTGVIWGDEAPGMETVKAVARTTDPSGATHRAVHYIAGICSAYYMKEAMDWAAANGGITGPNVRKGMYQKKDWVPAGLEGVCMPSTWTDTDHRGTTTVPLLRAHVKGDTGAPLGELVQNGVIRFEKVATIEVPRKPEWLGW